MKLMKAGRDAETYWLLAKDNEGRLFVYVPNTGKWHRQKALEHDYYVDQDLTYAPIDEAEAAELMKQKTGKLDGRSRGWLLAEYRADQQAKDTSDVMPAGMVGRQQGARVRSQERAERLRSLPAGRWMPWNTYGSQERQTAHVNASDLRAGRIRSLPGPVEARVVAAKKGFRVEVARKVDE